MSELGPVGNTGVGVKASEIRRRRERFGVMTLRRIFVLFNLKKQLTNLDAANLVVVLHFFGLY